MTYENADTVAQWLQSNKELWRQKVTSQLFMCHKDMATATQGPEVALEIQHQRKVAWIQPLQDDILKEQVDHTMTEGHYQLWR